MTGVTLALVGGGLRGQLYARSAVLSGTARVTAIAEPDPRRRAALAEEFAVPAGRLFSGWAELAAAGRLADAAIIATQDQLHTDPAVRLADLGYHILLEKPMATSEQDADAIATAAERNGIILAVCHVLRYTPYTRMLKGLLDSGRIGRLVNVQHLEPVGWWHHAHSFVRGNWRRSDTSAAMLLTKACHDLDWLIHLYGALPSRVSSFGSLTHFKAADRPIGAAARCVECPLEQSCAYSAKRLYLDCLADPDRHFWPLGAVTDERTEAGVLEALRTGPYGRCVYACDNDVVDHQVVNLEFPDGGTCSFTMSAFTPMEHRQTRLCGTKGYLDGNGRTIRLVDFLTGTEEILEVPEADGDGHGGGDQELITTFLRAVETADPALLPTDAGASLATHRVVWAAEQARTTGTVVTL
ncbi:Gfo/Idh/MocA family oxidoreductase [Kribbella qitaiheensis]|uniref:Gfo/Idh/MocA family oxidoreductase n=1 Tax=Kribbella qitaiheensis TaxID=1544730 RepID=A0A7G6X4Z3_9ACTN|nr:Gfo/Idh/MocA family oxidoreductase [Kribbella qitaiheensis]QNE21308.1 Gfo/Idh/MocA family oxidoreductase [Kribbella qitaiheensis]